MAQRVEELAAKRNDLGRSLELMVRGKKQLPYLVFEPLG